MCGGAGKDSMFGGRGRVTD
ncbi:MAG: hypothetical protein ACREXW_06915 [Gammaproteobacteria bacterium]